MNIKHSFFLTKNDWALILRAFKYLIPYKVKYGVLLALSVLGSVIGLLDPVIYGKLIDSISTKQVDKLIPWIAILVLLFISNSLLGVIRSYLAAKVSINVNFKIKRDYYQKVLYLQLKHFDRFKIGEVISRLEIDVSGISGFMTQSALSLVLSLIQVIVVGFIAFKINFKLSLILVFVMPVFFLISKLLGDRLRAYSLERMEDQADYFSHMQDSISGIKEIRVLNIEDHNINKFKSFAKKLIDVNIKTTILQSLASATNGGINLTGKVVLLGMGGHQVINGNMSIGMFVAFIAYYDRISGVLMNLAQLNTRIQMSMASIKRVFDFFDISATGTIREIDSINKHFVVKGDIAFEKVYFEYEEGKSVLKALSFNIRENQVTALVGKNGSGKTTIFNLILKLYEPLKGKIILDSYEISDLCPRRLRDQISYVSQEIFFFDATIRENFLLAKPDASEKEIMEACEMACFDSVLESLPENLDTNIKERNVKLSVGEKQRFALARAVLKRSKIFLVDEGTAHLDNLSQNKIVSVIKKLSVQHTVVIISHNLSTIRIADNILVVNDGILAGEGSHEDLIKKNSIYQNLFATKIKKVSRI